MDGNGISVSSKLAMSLGYDYVENPKAYDGVCYMKDEKIWIHDLGALMYTLQCSEADLVSLNYDVETYHSTRKEYSRLLKESVDEWFRTLGL